jgi:hypothetical protein
VRAVACRLLERAHAEAGKDGQDARPVLGRITSRERYHELKSGGREQEAILRLDYW